MLTTVLPDLRFSRRHRKKKRKKLQDRCEKSEEGMKIGLEKLIDSSRGYKYMKPCISSAEYGSCSVINLQI